MLIKPVASKKVYFFSKEIEILLFYRESVRLKDEAIISNDHFQDVIIEYSLRDSKLDHEPFLIIN